MCKWKFPGATQNVKMRDMAGTNVNRQTVIHTLLQFVNSVINERNDNKIAYEGLSEGFTVETVEIRRSQSSRK